MSRYVKILFTLAVAAGMLFSVYTGISKHMEHETSMQNAVTVTATVEGSVEQFREKQEFFAGAGDTIDTYTSIETYHIYVLSYTYQGTQYRCGYSEYPGSTGSQISVRIDPAQPDCILSDQSGATADFVFGGMFGAIFLVLIIVWYRRKRVQS